MLCCFNQTSNHSVYQSYSSSEELRVRKYWKYLQKHQAFTFLSTTNARKKNSSQPPRTQSLLLARDSAHYSWTKNYLTSFSALRHTSQQKKTFKSSKNSFKSANKDDWNLHRVSRYTKDTWWRENILEFYKGNLDFPSLDASRYSLKRDQWLRLTCWSCNDQGNLYAGQISSPCECLHQREYPVEVKKETDMKQFGQRKVAFPTLLWDWLQQHL